MRRCGECDNVFLSGNTGNLVCSITREIVTEGSPCHRPHRNGNSNEFDIRKARRDKARRRWSDEDSGDGY